MREEKGENRKKRKTVRVLKSKLRHVEIALGVSVGLNKRRSRRVGWN